MLDQPDPPATPDAAPVSDAPTQEAPVQETPALDATAAAVERCMGILLVDPRTSEIAQSIPGAVQSLAALNGVQAEAGTGLPPEMMAEIFQGISDAWSKANQ